MGTARGILADKRDEILRLAALHGAGHIRVFGSVARGEDHPDSDIDLLVDMQDGRSLLDPVRFWRGVRNLTGRKVDVVDEGGFSPYIRDRTHLSHIRDRIASIQDYTRQGKDAVYRKFEIIGEASNRLSDEVKICGRIPWDDIKVFRNFLIHQYNDIRPSLVWEAVENDLPALDAHVNALLSDS